MEELSFIEMLPVEILIKIIEVVPNRWNLSMVNKNFYELCCEIDAFQFKMKLIDVSKFGQNDE